MCRHIPPGYRYCSREAAFGAFPLFPLDVKMNYRTTSTLKKKKIHDIKTNCFKVRLFISSIFFYVSMRNVNVLGKGRCFLLKTLLFTFELSIKQREHFLATRGCSRLCGRQGTIWVFRVASAQWRRLSTIRQRGNLRRWPTCVPHVKEIIRTFGLFLEPSGFSKK